MTDIEAMRVYGGSFVKALADALALADRENERRIRKAFPDVIDRYRDLAARADQVESVALAPASQGGGEA